MPAAPKPGIVPLRPLGVGELLDGAITVLRSRPRQTLLVAAVVAVVVNVVRALATHAVLGGSQDSFADLTSPSPEVALSAVGDVLSRTLIVGGLQVVVGLIGTTILTGLLTVVVSRAVLGQTVSTGEAWARVRPRLGALFGVTLLGGLLWLAGFLVAGLVGGAIALAGSGAAGAAVFGLLALVWVPFAIWLYVLVALAPVALVLEGQGVVAALRRSRALVAGAFWRTLGLLLLVVVIASVVDGIIGIPFSVLGSGTAVFTGDPAAAYSAVALTLTAVGGIVSQTITLPFTAAAVVLVYVDRRMRREGLDLELARAAAAEQAPAPSGGWTPGA
ncbi:MAG TPA: hypothetical protein VFS29_06990 [Motilibacteraceae bacterium]|nr:hypothetical protein [Motilibacteraceae bacterium]